MIKYSISLTLFMVACTAPNTPQHGQEQTSPASAEDPSRSNDGQPAAGANQDKKTTDSNPSPDPTSTPSPGVGIEVGNLNVQWIAGAANCAQDNNPPIQVHAYNKNLSILRQNKCLNYEGPFMYLIFGAQKALLIDTGATGAAASFPIRTTVENQLLEHYGSAAERAKITLVVAHSHAHGDHRAADAQFNSQPGTTVVGLTQPAVASFFGIGNWPESMADFDLGGRSIKVIPLPGHEASHVAYYDAQTGLLLSGDTLYPGRLYVENWEAFRASVARLRSFAEGKAVSQVLGAHIEMSKTPGKDYPIGSTYQPDEHVLQLSKDSLILLDNELKNIGPTPARKVLNDFIIDP